MTTGVPSQSVTPSSSSTEPSTWSNSTLDERPQSQSHPAWPHHLSASFQQLSTQLQAASQAVSTVPPSSNHAMAALVERLEGIEERQRRLEADLMALKDELSIRPVQSPDPGTDVAARLKELADQFKLDQERLPARLYNALATKSPSPVKILPMRNRKLPPNFPSTRGEFEHLTKERYEGLLANYDIPISGDTAAKRESLRAFLGIPTNIPEKK